MSTTGRSRTFRPTFRSPEGVPTHPSLESQIVTDPETTDLFEVGSGSGQAYVYWECTWMMQVLAAGGVGEKADQGLDMLESALDSDMRGSWR